ncbi:MAG: hypothetical protein M3P26_03750 [Gemmatimonadota bacterium]|nr:hypothetical protein [Gemmatimonadota bacterium]
MTYNNLRSQSIEDLLGQVQGFSAMASQPQVQAAAAVAARCTIELADAMRALSDTAFTAKKQIVERLDELNVRLKAHEEALRSASDEASTQTRTLLRWNKGLVIATAAYTLITFLLLLATVLK